MCATRGIDASEAGATNSTLNSVPPRLTHMTTKACLFRFLNSSRNPHFLRSWLFESACLVVVFMCLAPLRVPALPGDSLFSLMPPETRERSLAQFSAHTCFSRKPHALSHCERFSQKRFLSHLQTRQLLPPLSDVEGGLSSSLNPPSLSLVSRLPSDTTSSGNLPFP